MQDSCDIDVSKIKLKLISMKRIFSFLLAAALFVTACDKNNGGTDTPPEPVNSDFTIEQTALTQGSLDVKIHRRTMRVLITSV